MLYDESSVVRGTGNVSIKGSFGDRALDSTGWMKGTGSISLESLRSMNKNRPMVNFTQKSDLVFEGGQLRSERSLESPLFYGGVGASVNERFNLSHVDKSEIDMIRSNNRSDNTLVFNTNMAFEGIWDIKNQQGSNRDVLSTIGDRSTAATATTVGRGPIGVAIVCPSPWNAGGSSVG